MDRRQYSDKDKATALTVLDANGGSLRKTAREIGIPPTTLKEWKDGRVNPHVAELRTVKKGELAERFDDATDMMLDVLHEKLKDATLQQVVTSIGILQDKSQLLKGRPTDRTEVLDNLSDDERASRVAALLDRARTRRDGQSDSE